MPTKKTVERAHRKEREGKKPTTQAGEFVKEEMHRYEQGDPQVKSRKQAIAIGLSEARRAGVKLSPPKNEKSSVATRKKAAHDKTVGESRAKSSRARASSTPRVSK
jgi:hypothetical protein